MPYHNPQTGRFTAKDPIGDTGGDHDLWDYCVDDPVSKNDPSGLFRKWIAKKVGGAIAGYLSGLGWIITPNKAGEPESMYTIREDIQEIEKKIDDKKATPEDFKRIRELREQEKKLWDKFGEHYDSNGYEHVFPNKEYTKREIENATARKSR